MFHRVHRLNLGTSGLGSVEAESLRGASLTPAPERIIERLHATIDHKELRIVSHEASTGAVLQKGRANATSDKTPTASLRQPPVTMLQHS